MQSISFIGRLSRNVDLKTTPNGVQVASFTVAVDRKQKNKDGEKITDFFNVNVWRGLADICSKFLSKGKNATCAVSYRCERTPRKMEQQKYRSTFRRMRLNFSLPRAKNVATQMKAELMEVGSRTFLLIPSHSS